MYNLCTYYSHSFPSEWNIIGCFMSKEIEATIMTEKLWKALMEKLSFAVWYHLLRRYMMNTSCISSAADVNCLQTNINQEQ